MGRRSNVSYVLLAEFDIDAGSLLSRQLPCATGVDPQLLAELMLPEGVHDVEEDWTVFMLNQTPENTCQIMSDDNDDNVLLEHDAPPPGVDGQPTQPLLHGLNLVFRKYDPNVKRKWTVKALAICTQHPYIHMFKPVLFVALQAYFEDPSEAVLHRLYDAVTAMDLSMAPTLSRYERLIMRQMDRPAAAAADAPHNASVESFGANARSRTSSMASKQHDGDSTLVDSATGTGSFTSGPNASNESLARPPLPTAAKLPAEKDLSYIDGRIFQTSITYQSRPPAPPVTLPVRVPLTAFPEDVGEYSLVSFINTFSSATSSVTGPIHSQLHTNGNLTHPIIVLFNALLTQKRIIFLGSRAGTVSQYVLAACALASGCGTVLRGFIERAFPYAHLTLYENLIKFVPGSIAGVTNPIFEQKWEWWDLLCNINTGKVVVNKDINAAPPPLAHFPAVPAATPLPLSRTDTIGSGGTEEEPALRTATQVKEKARDDHPDNVFMDEILALIQQHHGEQNVRQRFTEYVQRFVRLASRFEEEYFRRTDIGFPTSTFNGQHLGSGSIPIADQPAFHRELSANASRIEGWRKTRSYEYYIVDFGARRERSAFRGVDLTHQFLRLHHARMGMSDQEVAAIVRAFAEQTLTKGYDAVVELLAHMPASRGGLTPVALGLFSQTEAVRELTVDLVSSLKAYDVGRLFIRLLNHFQRFAYVRLACQREALHGVVTPQPLPQQQQQQLATFNMTRSPSNHSESSLGHP
ncbi:spindle pole body interacting protein [Auriculariales sp. MPI-PUGE-AT-0066]|nr:spindle pole body interacting protein [Auriculariales sp. MPI-PUGE-AT-0066]